MHASRRYSFKPRLSNNFNFTRSNARKGSLSSSTGGVKGSISSLSRYEGEPSVYEQRGEESFQFSSVRNTKGVVQVLWPVTIKGNPSVSVNALVDTGAESCVVNPSILSRLGNCYKR